MAASPMPGASYMVSNMSSTSFLRSPRSILATGFGHKPQPLVRKDENFAHGHGPRFKGWDFTPVNCVLFLFCREAFPPPAHAKSIRANREWRRRTDLMGKPPLLVAACPDRCPRRGRPSAFPFDRGGQRAPGGRHQRRAACRPARWSNWARRVQGHGRTARRGANPVAAASVQRTARRRDAAHRPVDAEIDQAHRRAICKS